MSLTDAGLVGAVKTFNDLLVESKVRGSFAEILEFYDFLMGDTACGGFGFGGQ
jgi:hypothetical protein